MSQRLGYTRYGAQGGDTGAIVRRTWVGLMQTTWLECT
jgi:hypothetical protein